MTVARQMHACGEHTISAIADILGVARFTVYRALGWDGDTGRLFRSGIGTGQMHEVWSGDRAVLTRVVELYKSAGEEFQPE